MYNQLSLLTDTSVRWTPIVLVPAFFQLFDCNYTLYETDTSLRWTTDTFETINGQLRSALCSGKPPQTRKVGALYDTNINCKMFAGILVRV